MIPAPVGENESARLAALQRYAILDTAAEAQFDDFTQLASQLCGVPIALISLVDEKRQWFKSRLGLNASETPRDISFCGHALFRPDILEVPNALEDERFCDNPLVTSPPGIRFYAGMPLITPDGHAIGTLCVIDLVPRQLSAAQRSGLAALSRQLMQQLELRLIGRDLRESDARFRSLVNLSSDWFWELDDQFRFVRFAGGEEDFSATYGADSLGKTRWEVPGVVAMGEHWPAHRADLAAHRRFRHFEYQHTDPQGRLNWLSVSGEPLFDDTGCFRGYRGIGRNITSRKAADQQLRDITNGVPGAIYQFLWPDEGAPQLRFISAAVKSLIGLDAVAVERNPQLMFDAVVEADRAELFASMRAARSLGQSHWRQEFRIRRADGELCWTRSEASAVQSGGELVWNGFWVDITEQKKISETMAMERNRLDLALANSGLSSWDADIQTGMVGFDARWSEMLGGDAVPTEITMDAVLRLAPAEDFERLKQAVTDTLTGKTQEYRVEHQVKTATGGWCWIESHGKAVARDANGRVTRVIGIARNISAQKAAEKALEEARRHAEHANAAKGMLLATMSHEIRTPLNGMVGMMELLDLTNLDREQKSTLAIARDSANSLGRIVNDILDHEKMEAGRLEIITEPTMVPQLLQRVMNTYQAAASAKGLTLSLSVDPQLDIALHADPLRIIQVLGNFVSNAIKFTNEGSVALHAGWHARDGDNVTFTLAVTDTGIGMSREAQSRIFSPFEQAAIDTTRLYGGTGLGLAISRRLVELMGGAINIQSVPERGTTMSVCLTLRMAGQESIAALVADTKPRSDAPAQEAAPLPLPAKSVLAVDDNPINRMLLSRQLETLGMKVTAATNGSEAFELWRAGNFDLVVTDINMPVMDGYGLSRAIRAEESAAGRVRIPVLAWTANAMADVMNQSREAGMDDLLTKPAGLAQLGALLAKWLPGGDDDHAPAIDINQVIDVFGDANATETEMYRRICEAAKSQITELDMLLAAGDLKVIEATSHRLKGATGMIGATPLSLVCGQIETAAREADASALPGLQRKFARESRRALDALAML